MLRELLLQIRDRVCFPEADSEISLAGCSLKVPCHHLWEGGLEAGASRCGS